MRSRSVTAAAALILLGSVVLGGFGVLGILTGLLFSGGAQDDGTWRLLAIGLCGFAMAPALLGLAAGIGVLLLKRWGRIAALLFGAVVWLEGLFILYTLVTRPLSRNDLSDPSSSLAWVPLLLFRLLMALMGGVPIGLATWWLVLFTRPAVVAQFNRSTAGTSARPPALGSSD